MIISYNSLWIKNPYQYVRTHMTYWWTGWYRTYICSLKNPFCDKIVIGSVNIGERLRPYYFHDCAHMYNISLEICTRLPGVLFCGDCAIKILKDACDVFYLYVSGLFHCHFLMRWSSAWGLWMNWSFLINPWRAGPKHSGFNLVNIMIDDALTPCVARVIFY